MSCPRDNFAEPFEFTEDGVRGRSPGEGLRVLIPVIDELLDAFAQVRYRGEGAAPDRALRDQAEPTFHLIQPGTVGGRVVDVETRMTREPAFDFGVFVRAVVIDDEMQIQVRRHGLINMPEKAQKLLMPMARLALSEHGTFGDIECGEQRGRAVTIVVMRDALEISQAHWQNRLTALKRLNLQSTKIRLGPLINAKVICGTLH